MIKKFLKYHPIHKKIAPNLDTLFILRPTLFFSVWVMVVIGMSCAQMYYFDLPLWIVSFSLNTFNIFLGITFICSSAFIINQISDIESDSINKKLFIVGNFITKEKSYSISKKLLIVGFALLILTNWFVSILCGIIFLIWGLAYNKKPFHWKSRPLLGWFANSLVGALLFSIGWSIVVINNPISIMALFNSKIISIMLPYILCFSSVSLITTIPDIKGDLNTGDNTFPIVFGKNTTLFISLLLVSISLMISLRNNDPISSNSILVSFPFFIIAFIRKLDKDILRAIRYPISILNFFVLSIYPLLFIPLIITFYISKYYYWHRFNIHYPTFLVDND